MDLKFIKIVAIKEFVIRIICISIFSGISFGLDCYTNTDIDESGPVVTTKTGTIVGKYVKTLNQEVPVFLGIPFAEPPVGEKRFQITKPILSWNGTLFAKEKSPACMQYSTREVGWIPRGLDFSEDCLYLNVWLPPNCCCNRLDKLPVMLWLFSGGYYSGSGMMDIYDGDVLTTLGEVIVVSINYRVNVFGFLNVDSKEAPGNQGLYDQLLALKWVRKNIHYFGGDPNSVTLFGESTGSISVSLQMISPLARGLFQKAILESGNGYQSIKVDAVDEAIDKARQLSKLVGCSVDSSNNETLRNDILDCLKNKEADELTEADNYFTSKYPTFFEPSYGNTCAECLKYFLEDPMDTIQSGDFAQIPTLIGNNNDEGTLFMIYTIPRIFRRDLKPLLTVPVSKKLLRDFFDLALKSHGRMTISSDKIFDYYMENINETGSDIPLKIVSKIYGDYIIKCGNMFLADHTKDVYFYIYTHRSQKDTNNEWVGVPHFSEVPYVFGQPIKNSENYTVEDVYVSRNIIQKWTSFAYHGYPVTKGSEPEWPKYSSSDRKLFELNAKSKIVQFPSQKACEELWNPIFDRTTPS